MAKKVILILFLIFISLISQAASQGYMGTVSTGTGILSPLTVGSGQSPSAASVGSISSQANLTGTWSVDLKGSQVRHFDLQIIQVSNLIQGSGTMAAGEGAVASGSVAGDRPTVFISLIDQPVAFRLELSASGTSLAGKYDSLTASGQSESGTVTGSMTLTGGQSQISNLAGGINPSATSGAYVGAAAKSLDSTSSAKSVTINRDFYQTYTGLGASSEGTSVTSGTG
ncbi:MAG: hypothetical protein EHM14_14775 [Methanothrix sp.]|nr:MAG: hypothetical protein EHM14_14775 [Methanothrix sp.]